MGLDPFLIFQKILSNVPDMAPEPRKAVVRCLGQIKYHIWYLILDDQSNVHIWYLIRQADLSTIYGTYLHALFRN
jgi:hypothetical protein